MNSKTFVNNLLSLLFIIIAFIAVLIAYVLYERFKKSLPNQSSVSDRRIVV
nr:hydrophobic protein p6a [Lingue ampelovirus 1]